MICKNAKYSGLLLLLLAPACGEDSTPTPPGASGASAGGAASGGVSASGASSGGASTSGGAVASGGTSSGGASSGGAGTSGGAASGGASAGSATTGGATGKGGSGTTSGGSAAGGGSAGKGSGGSAGSGTPGGGSGGATTGMGGASPSTGCGKTTWPPGDGTTLQTIDVGGTARQYILALPTGYDPNKAYRVIYAWHGRTGTAAQIAGGGNRGFYGLKSLLPDSIFVAGQGLGTTADPADTGWPNTGGQDINMVKALVAYLAQNYCVDQSRLMSTGFSYGGIMSNTIGCQMSDVFRAIAPIAGAYFGGRGSACNTHPIAYFGIHGTADDQVTYANGETARDLFRTSDHCMTTTMPAEPPAGCVRYDGCDAGYPVYWCSHTGGHTVPSTSGAGIAAFFKQF